MWEIRLGADHDFRSSNTQHSLRPGTSLLFYTDGLIRVRRRSLDRVMDALLYVEKLSDWTTSQQALERRARGDLCVLAGQLA